MTVDHVQLYQVFLDNLLDLLYTLKPEDAAFLAQFPVCEEEVLPPHSDVAVAEVLVQLGNVAVLHVEDGLLLVRQLFL